MTRHPSAFRSELELQKYLSQRILLPGVGAGVMFQRRHVPVGGCIPDLVTVQFREPPPSDLWPQRWTYRHAHVVWLLRKRRTLKVGTIARLAFESDSGIERVVRDLVRCKAVLVGRDGLLRLSPGILRMRPTVIAVEVKLKRWREALAQARAYRRFADRVYVALDANHAPEQQTALTAFRRTGVGLCLIKPPMEHWIVPARRSHGADCPEREYLVAAAGLSQRHGRWSRL